MKYILISLCLLSLGGYSQDFKSQIALHRKNYAEDFLKDTRSPLKEKDLQYLRFYEADNTYNVKATATILTDAEPFIMPVFAGSGAEYVPYALLKFHIKGKPQKLTVYRNTSFAKRPELADYLFLPFTDKTNSATTYAGGRYIDLRTGDFNDGTVSIDFNKAYNPYCAFSGGYSCPKPPEANHLKIAIEAGEKSYASDKKH
ncbi:DUF1684 domain-containing protein [Pedobacter sp. PWIIR3]